jgi:hypothetical protein
MGIYFGVMGISSLTNMASIFFDSSRSPAYLYISPIIFIISGVVLFGYAYKLSHFVIDFSEVEENSIHITASEKTTRIALLVLGIYLFSQALPQFIQSSINIGLYYSNINEIPEDVRHVQKRWIYLIGPIVKLIISTVLIIGPDKIIGLLARYDETFKRVEKSNKANSADTKSRAAD